ncbi:MAG: serine/threonine-protein kinase [Acidimicrobiales bacterium]
MVAKVRDIASYSDARLIGEGGFGAVYRARDEDHNRDVAIKVLPSELGDDERRRFERERQTMGLLGAHPFVIPVYESGFTDKGEAYIVMEFAAGGSMGERVRSTNPVPWAEAAKIMAAVADAVQTAHENGVLHRDIKPDNVLIDQFGHPKLADFGIAAVASSNTSTTNTATTIAHASPELMRGEPSAEASDIYAIGSTVYALIKGTPAFFRSDDDDMAPMVDRIQSDPPPDLRKFGIPDELATVIERAMAKDPADRQPSAMVLAQELRTAAAGHGPPTGPLMIAPGDLPTIGKPPATNGSSPGDTSSNGSSAKSSSKKGPSKGSTGKRSAAKKAGAVGAGGAAAAARGDDAESEPSTTDEDDADTAPDESTDTKPSSKQGAANKTKTDDDDTAAEEVGDDSDSDATAGDEDAGADGDGDGQERSSEPDETGDVASGGVHMAGEPPLPPRRFESLPEPETTWSAGRIAALGVSVAAFIAAIALAVVLIRGDQTTTGESAATVEVDCPTVIPVDAKVFCSIFTTEAESGQWHLPAFLSEPQPIETVPGEYEIFIAPTNPEAVGREFALVVDVDGSDGIAERLEHQFAVVDLFAEVNCPEQIPLNDSVVCDIVSYNATDGEWRIPRFGGAPLEIVPGADPIFVEPRDPDSVGQSYEISVEVRNAAGDSYIATSEFEVTAAS